jgi:hypothetical protein
MKPEDDKTAAAAPAQQIPGQTIEGEVKSRTETRA